MKKALIIFLAFVGFQLITSAAVNTWIKLFSSTPLSEQPTLIGLTLIVSSLGTMAFVLWLVGFRDLKWKRKDRKYVAFTLKSLLFAAIVSIPVMVLGNLITEYARLDNNNLSLFLTMKDNPGCLLSMILIGPVAEEITFRYGIMGAFRQKGINVRVSILVSSLLFGLVHMNPAQSLATTIIGLYLGWLYSRTNTLLYPILVHLLNNGIGVLTLFLYPQQPQPDYTPFEALGYTAATMLILAPLLKLYSHFLDQSAQKTELTPFSYCPRCGSAKFVPHDEKSRQCRVCGFTYYFNVAAATAALILNQRGELLICIRAKEPSKGTFDLPGGFVDRNESMEDGLARELREELHAEVQSLQFLFSFPNTYPYGGLDVKTVDSFFLCRLKDEEHLSAHDDVATFQWIPLHSLDVAAFGLPSIRKGITRFLQTSLPKSPKQKTSGTSSHKA